MPNWLVLGLGNALAGADGFGPAVVERLRGDLPRATGKADPSRSSIEIADAGTDLLDWIARFPDYDRVVLVDAVAVDSGSTGIAVLDETAFAQWNARSPGVHAMSPVMAVRLFRTLQRGAGTTTGAPVIQLVGLFVAESDFARPPDAPAIDAGAAAVRRLVSGE